MLSSWIDNIRPYLDPMIKTILICGVPLIIMFFIRKLTFPTLNVMKISKFKGLPYTPTDKKSLLNYKWTKHLLLISKSISNSSVTADQVITKFLTSTLGSFIGTFLAYGFLTGNFQPKNFSVDKLFDSGLWLISLMAASLPYCIMRIRLHQIRVKNSYDVIPAVNTLIMKYSEYRGNLYYAVLDTTKTLKGDILYAFNGLLPSLQGASGSDLDESVELFIFRTKTTWAIQLGILIHKSEEQGDDIELGLKWLASDMSEVQQITEVIKADNRENVQLGYLPFILFPASIYLNQYPSAGKSWHYYFNTPLGIKMVLFTLLFTTLCAFVAYIIQKPRNEV